MTEQEKRMIEVAREIKGYCTNLYNNGECSKKCVFWDKEKAYCRLYGDVYGYYFEPHEWNV